MADTDPENEVGDEEAPHHWAVQASNAETLVDHEPSRAHSDKHTYSQHADGAKEPLRRVQDADQQLPVYLSRL